MELSEINFKRRRPLALQLAPMIDIFTLLIVFLLKSTVVSDIAIVFPSDLKAPVSSEKESLESFPEVFVYKDRLDIPFLKLSKQIGTLKDLSNGDIDAFKSKAEQYRQQSDLFSKSTVVNINLLAGSDNSYKNIFDCVSFLRKMGFQSIQFIAESDKVK